MVDFLIKDMVADVMSNLGKDISWGKAKSYVDANYKDNGVNKNNYYTARNRLLAEGLREYLSRRPTEIRNHITKTDVKKIAATETPQVVEAPPVATETPQVIDLPAVDVTLDDVKKVAQCVRLMGSEERLLRALNTLKELRV